MAFSSFFLFNLSSGGVQMKGIKEICPRKSAKRESLLFIRLQFLAFLRVFSRAKILTPNRHQLRKYRIAEQKIITAAKRDHFSFSIRVLYSVICFNSSVIIFI